MQFESLNLNNEERAKAPGKFLELSQGIVHYEVKGKGDPILLVHGFSVPSFYWEKTVPFLVDAGYKVYTIDLYGRGFSDRPHTKYDEKLFVTQLNQFIYHEMRDISNLILIGLSMGGAIASFFTHKFPFKIKKLILLAPAGLPMPIGIRLKLLKVPILGKFLFNRYGNKALLNGLKSDFSDSIDDYESFKEKYAEQMKYKGFRRAIFSTMKHFPMTSMNHIYSELKDLEIPILLLWGKDDMVLPFTNAKILQDLAGCKLVKVQDCGHALQYQKPKVVNSEIVNFLTSSDNKS